MRVDDVVADLELDVLDLTGDLEVLDLLFGLLGNGVLLRKAAGCRPAAFVSGLQVAVHEVDLLQPAKALADVLRADLPDALDRLQLGVGGGEHLVEPAELAHDLRDDELRQPRDAAEDAGSRAARPGSRAC